MRSAVQWAMAAVLSLILVLALSLVVVRVATVALVLTGLSRDLARFQARSAFTGTGYTTSETEEVVRHPVRRRIVMLLMLLGNAGIATVIASMILSFTSVPGPEGVWWNTWWFRLLFIVVAVSGLLYVAYSKWVDRRMSSVIAWALKRYTDIDLRDYAGLLHLTGQYAVSEILVREGDWVADRSLEKLHLNAEGVLVLGIERPDGRYVGAPRGQTALHPGDVLIVYGRDDTLTDLDQRRAGPQGNRRHIEAVQKQATLERHEREQEIEQQT